MQQPLFETSPNGNGSTGNLSMREVLAAQAKIPRDNPDDTPDDERVQLVMRFKLEAEASERRKKAVERWKQADLFIDGEQWSTADKGKLDPHQAQLTINRVFPFQETRVALMAENLVQVEVLPRDPADDTFARELDGFLIHEGERRGLVKRFFRDDVAGIGTFNGIYQNVLGYSCRGRTRCCEVRTDFKL